MAHRRHSNLKADKFSKTSITGAGNVIKRPIDSSGRGKKFVPPPSDSTYGNIYLLKKEGDKSVWMGNKWFLIGWRTVVQGIPSGQIYWYLCWDAYNEYSDTGWEEKYYPAFV